MGKKVPARIKRSTRYVAMALLTKVETQQAYSNLLVNQAMMEAGLSEKDGRLLTEIVYGAISRKLTLEFYLAPFIANAKKVEPWVRQLLLLSLYQLEYLDRVPAHAIVDEAVEIAKARGNVGTGKFVNGVLRSFQRQGAAAFETIKDPVERLGTEISMPRWLTEKLIGLLGMEAARELGLSLFEPSKVSARVNTALIDRDTAIHQLAEEGIEVTLSELSPFGIVGAKGFLAGSTLFKEGQLTIQDESSMLVAPALQIEATHQVLDACAAPGGKTTHMATYIDETQGGRITALDIHAHKVKLIEENASRLHVSERIIPQVLDARKVGDEFPDEFFDRILADVPCSGLGLLRRKPDIKYSKKEEDFVNLPRIQLEILESLATKVKQYGIITYSTCTIASEENQEVIAAFLAKHDNFEIVPVVGSEKLQASADGTVTIYPHQYQTDGFFICCLRRI